MPKVVFTAHLLKHGALQPAEVAGASVAEALQAVFQEQPELKGYVLDDQGRVRQHVVIFVNDRPLVDRNRLTDPVIPTSEIYVLQALSGG